MKGIFVDKQCILSFKIVNNNKNKKIIVKKQKIEGGIKKMKNRLKEMKGITLIALVVTIALNRCRGGRI